MSLSHDYHMTTHEANQLTQDFDIRKLFNTMQFWLAGRTASTDSTHLISLVSVINATNNYDIIIGAS